MSIRYDTWTGKGTMGVELVVSIPEFQVVRYPHFYRSVPGIVNSTFGILIAHSMPLE